MKRSILFYLLFLIIGIILGYLLHQYGLGANVFTVITGEQSEWFWAMTQAFIVLVSLMAIYQQVKLQSYSNGLGMLQQIVSLRGIWDGLEMRRYRKAVCEEYNQKTAETPINAETEVLNFFEEMGVLFKMQILPVNMIWEFYSYHIENMWPMLEKKVKAVRVRDTDQTYFENSEQLWRAMLAYSKKKGLPSTGRTEGQIKAYVEEELRDLKDIQL